VLHFVSVFKKKRSEQLSGLERKELRAILGRGFAILAAALATKTPKFTLDKAARRKRSTRLCLGSWLII
jgi:hypothetical protein